METTGTRNLSSPTSSSFFINLNYSVASISVPSSPPPPVVEGISIDPISVYVRGIFFYLFIIIDLYFCVNYYDAFFYSLNMPLEILFQANTS